MTEDSPYCTSADIVYSATLANGDQLPDFVIFDSTTRTVSWVTSDQLDANTYDIKVTGTITNAHTDTHFASETFTLTVQTVSCVLSTDTISVGSTTPNDANY